MLLGIAGVGFAAEALQYKVTYRGVFSLGRDMPIADLRLDTRRLSDEPAIRVTQLEASSRAYSLVESLYPIRYRLASWATESDQHLLGFETWQKTRDNRHRLYLRDGSPRGVRSLRPDKSDGRAALDQLEQGRVPGGVRTDGSLTDRLGLLDRVRRAALYSGAEYDYPVTNGKDRFRYRIRVESSEVLRMADRQLPAWKLRFDATELHQDGRETVAHRAAFVWLSQTPEQVPLRVDSRHPIGLFRVELAPGQLPAHRVGAPGTPLATEPVAINRRQSSGD